MFNFLSKICSIFILLSSSLKISVKCAEYEALHLSRNFPRATYDVVKMEEFRYPGINVPTATACPANSPEEDSFNRQYSFGKNSLFVRNIYDVISTSSTVEYFICDNPYKMSAIYDRRNVEFQFGFEIYHDKSKYGRDTFVDSMREDYDTLLISHEPGIPYSSHVQSLPGTDNISMGFVWIHTFQTKYNFESNRLVQSEYNLSQTTRGFHDCDDYDLGKEFFNGLEMNNLYLEDNQKRMLEGVKLPTSESDDKYEEMVCEAENQCFTKWLSVPAELFHFLAAHPISCSDILTVPIWKSTIEHVLDKFDKFLYAFSRVIKYPLGRIKVLSGIHGILKLRTDPQNAESTKTITLSPSEKGMPVPDLIYKLVKYEIEICKKPEETSENTNCKSTSVAMIVVIHNNPYFDSATDKICEDMCTNWGWQEIQNVKKAGEKFTSKYIYCCPANDPEVRKKLGLENGYQDSEILLENSGFSLRSFPLFDYETEKFEPEDIHDAVILQYTLNELFTNNRGRFYELGGLGEVQYSSIVNGLESLRIEEPNDEGDRPTGSEMRISDKKETGNPSEKKDN